MESNFTFLEFFAGAGMTRIGLGPAWRCLLANDFDSMKCDAYRENFGDGELIENDIANLTLADMPKIRADLMWGSFPCQDLSLAGRRAGLGARRSGAYFGFHALAKALCENDRAPKIIGGDGISAIQAFGVDGIDQAARFTRTEVCQIGEDLVETYEARG